MQVALDAPVLAHRLDEVFGIDWDADQIKAALGRDFLASFARGFYQTNRPQIFLLAGPV